MNDSDVESQSEFELDSFPEFANPIHEKDSVVVAIKAMMTLKSFIFGFCLYLLLWYDDLIISTLLTALYSKVRWRYRAKDQYKTERGALHSRCA